ncbi:hypothetical protein CYMTET_36425, partial [Cymbomonas tetramitiformis]
VGLRRDLKVWGCGAAQSRYGGADERVTIDRYDTDVVFTMVTMIGEHMVPPRAWRKAPRFCTPERMDHVVLTLV